MSSVVSFSTGSNGNTSLPDKRWSEAEKAFWPYCQPHVEDKTGIWVEAESDWFYRNGGADESPDGFQIIDRIGGRRFTQGLTSRHPIVVTDSVSGKPCLLYGSGGSGPNVLSAANNGDIENASIISGGEEVNRLPLTGPGTGGSYAFAVRIPAPSATVNGVAFGTTVGGNVMGGCADGNPSPMLLFSFSDGIFSFYTRLDGGAVTTTGDRRTGDWLKVVVTYDPADNQTARVWFNAYDATPTVVPTFIGDFSSDSDARLPRIGARGETSATDVFIGFMGPLIFLKSPILNTTAARQAAFALLDEKVTA